MPDEIAVPLPIWKKDGDFLCVRECFGTKGRIEGAAFRRAKASFAEARSLPPRSLSAAKRRSSPVTRKSSQPFPPPRKYDHRSQPQQHDGAFICARDNSARKSQAEMAHPDASSRIPRKRTAPVQAQKTARTRAFPPVRAAVQPPASAAMAMRFLMMARVSCSPLHWATSFSCAKSSKSFMNFLCPSNISV